MTLLTNKNGGQVHAEGESLETLKRNGWVEVVEEKTASPSPAEAEKPAPVARTRRTTKK